MRKADKIGRRTAPLRCACGDHWNVVTIGETALFFRCLRCWLVARIGE